MKNTLSLLVMLFTLFIIDVNANTNSSNASAVETKVTYFSALQKNKEIVINWKTATEQDDAQFTIEKSTDGIHFNVVTTENGTGTNAGEHEYFTFDFIPSRGTSFYRLSQKNVDGTMTILDSQKIDYKVELTFIPNTADNQYSIFGIPKNTHASITLLNKDNKELATVPYKDNGAVMIDFLDYSDEVYFVNIKDDLNEWIRVIEK